ncbi:MAG: trypsin-like peptidase domain-containing protein [Candidatus Acidiferrales bacterium]|jgi:putative serine protease PepD
MTGTHSRSRTMRLVALGAIVGLGCYWAGSRWGTRGPDRVEAVPNPAKPPDTTGMSEDEAINVKVYSEAAPAVANIVTRTLEYDMFMDPVPAEGAGSGFVMDPRGYILTNNHVIENAQAIEVTLGDGLRFPAKLVGTDVRDDVALIKIDPGDHKLTALPIGDSSTLQVGQHVLAIGNPFGFQSTLTTGVVSALGRTVQTSEESFIDGAIQTDAAINRGNSGGPLLDSHGEVIGINSAMYSTSGTTAGIGFAIPINTAKRIANDLITEGRVRQVYLGIQATAFDSGFAQALGLPVDGGLLIESVDQNSPAARAGLRGGDRVVIAGMRRIEIGGDVITAVDGQKISSQLDMAVALDKDHPGDTVTLEIYRGNQKMDVRLTLGEQ